MDFTLKKNEDWLKDSMKQFSDTASDYIIESIYNEERERVSGTSSITSNLCPIIKLVYVFSAQDENLPNFVVFRGSIGKKLAPMSKNWADNYSGYLPLKKLKKRTISIKNYQNKGDLLQK